MADLEARIDEMLESVKSDEQLMSSIIKDVVANTNNAAECCQKLKRERPTSLEANVKKPKGSEFDEAPPQEAPARIVMPKASPMPPDRDYHRAVAKAVAVPKTHAKKRAGTRRNWEACLRNVSWHGAEARWNFILTWPRPTSKEEDEDFFSLPRFGWATCN